MATKTTLIHKLTKSLARINNLFGQEFLELLVKLVQESTRDHCECTLTLLYFFQIDSRDLLPKKVLFYLSPSQYAGLERETVTKWAGWHNTGCGRSQI